ncbi:MAG: response regulator, partial [Desulfobulbaceae bacterium]|nr:response regulator [Desulfobulbaceae bacterium]
PRYSDHIVDSRLEKVAEAPTSCGETVLLVEDEPALLKLGIMMLEQLGYQVLAAGTPGEAIALAEEHAGVIQLLVTDVVMPKMGGPDLAERLHSLYPDIRILFMSGYTANMIAQRGVLDESVNFIQKPFSLQSLAVKLRDAMR